MTNRFSDEQVEAWKEHGAVLVPSLFTKEEVSEVQQDFAELFPPPVLSAPSIDGADSAADAEFQLDQFQMMKGIPLDCSPALNLIGLHPQLIEFAKSALETDEVYLYQCHAWAKHTGVVDYGQPFHCDFLNHTLVVPSDDASDNCVTMISYFSDVEEGHGPMHYVPRSESRKHFDVEDAYARGEHLQKTLAPLAKSTAGPAGSMFAYTIDTYHRATNMTIPDGHRYAVMACYKKHGNERIGSMAWQSMMNVPWEIIFENATPDQLACLGIPRPGDRFWTDHTLEATSQRYPKWDTAPYREALERAALSASNSIR